MHNKENYMPKKAKTAAANQRARQEPTQRQTKVMGGGGKVEFTNDKNNNIQKATMEFD